MLAAHDLVLKLLIHRAKEESLSLTGAGSFSNHWY